MLSQRTVAGLSKLIKAWNGCSCKVGEEIVKFIGENGDKTEWVEVDGNDIRVRSGGTYSWHGKFCSCSSCSRQDVGR